MDINNDDKKRENAMNNSASEKVEKNDRNDKNEKNEKKAKVVEILEDNTNDSAEKTNLKKMNKEQLIDLVEALTEENENLVKEAEEVKAKVNSIKQQLESSNSKTDEYLGKLSGLKGDYERIKQRNKTAVEAATDEGKGYVIEKLIPILDTFDRAKLSVTDENTINALELIRKQFEALLSSIGIEEIEVLGEEFDPNLSNAIFKQHTDKEEEKGKVLMVTAKGYKYGDKILRYPQVAVGV
ncbi:MAG: nucleotide exchange factor GrpE [Clostridia bacterium]